jgi:DNA excision repair protein ERCC-4
LDKYLQTDITNYIFASSIERKSISDLFGSFASGRLYTQAEAMSKYYKVPALLIEFDPSKSFGLLNANELGMDIKTDSICSKIVILTLHFPKLRILWSKSAHETMRLFKGLKANHDEVDVEMAMEAGRSESVDALLEIDNGAEDDRINEAARDMLLRLPGVNMNNARRIMRECESLAELSKMDRNELRRIAGPLAGQRLFSFFRQKVNSA